jgi:anaerobic magnesium-protoporphyrin IX monomethyl ester cyclase
MMIDRQFEFKWYSYFRCANADDEVFDLAARSGCTGVFLGIESGDNRMLKEMYKTTTVDKYRYGLDKLRERIFSYASFIVGFPGETE